MAPIPANDQQPDQPAAKPDSKTWNTATIVVGAVFLFLLVAFIITLIVFCFIRRSQRNKLPPEHRPKPYRPFRTESTDKSALLADVQPTPDEDRSSMFSRERSSVSLYVDAEPVHTRASMDTVNLIPLRVTPPERPESLAGEVSNGRGVSNGSGISASSSRYSRGSIISLSPIQPVEDGDLGARVTRPRSTSTSSVRYYTKSSPESTRTPQIPVPKIVHTPSA